MSGTYGFNLSVEEGPLLKAGKLVAWKLKQADIELYNYQIVGKNMVFNTEIGGFLLKGEKSYWIMAERDTQFVVGHQVTINEEIFTDVILKHRLSFLYHCEEYGDMIKYMEYQSMLKEGVSLVQPSNKERVMSYPENKLQIWEPKREYIHYW